MRIGDPLLQMFLRDALQCAIMQDLMDFDDNTCIPESIDFDLDYHAEGDIVSSAGGSALRRPTASAADMANAILNPVSSSRGHATRSKEPLPALLVPLYPFVFRSYTDDHDAYAVIEWTNCSAANVWAILTSPHLVVGAAKSMAFMLTFAIKNQLHGQLKHFLGNRVDAIKSHISDRGIKVTPDLEKLFLECCAIPGVLPALATALANYNVIQNHVVKFKPTVFPEASEVQQWYARLAACMVEPCLQEFFHAMCNANAERLAVHEPTLRIASSKQRIVERITTDYVNNPSFMPQANPSISEWCETDFDSSVVGKEPRSWIWVASKIQAIKTSMTRLMSNFNKSGQNVNDADNCARDLEFFTDFAKRDALWFWIYLCWNRGNDIPAWNVTSLPEGESLDIGGPNEDSRDDTAVVSSSSSSKGNKKRGRTEADDALTSTVSGLVDVSRRALDAIISSKNSAAVAHHHYPSVPSSQSTIVPSPVPSPEKKRAEDLCAFKEQLSQLLDMKNMLPEDLQGPVDSCIVKVTQDVHDLVCVSVGDLTT